MVNTQHDEHEQAMATLLIAALSQTVDRAALETAKQHVAGCSMCWTRFGRLMEALIPAFVDAVYLHIAQPGTLSLNDAPIGYASAPGDYRVVLPGVGEQHITVESLFYQQQIVIYTDEKGNVNMTCQPIRGK